MKRIVFIVFLGITIGAVNAQRLTLPEVRQHDLEEYFTGKIMHVDLWPEGFINDNGMDYDNLPDSVWDMAPEMEVALPAKSEKPTKAVIICPGGGYVALAKYHEGLMWGQFFLHQNVAVITLTYRLPHQHPEIPSSDVYQAIRIVKAHCKEWNIDPDQIGIMGSSAGGHLASTVATHAPEELRPAFQILFYPVITMQKPYTHTYSHDMLLGKDASPDLEEYYSNEKQVDERTPRAFIVLADDDDDVSPVNSALYYLALKKQGIPVSLHSYPSGGHGFGVSVGWKYHSQLITDLSDWLK